MHVENYIYDMSPDRISKNLLDEQPGFADALFTFMAVNDNQAQHIIQSIDQSYRDICEWKFSAYDPFASFAFRVLNGSFSFVVKEIAAGILRHVAWSVNRFSAQAMVDNLISSGIEPMLEDIIKE